MGTDHRSPDMTEPAHDESFTITRTLAATLETVWTVWTTPEHFARWFGTEAVEIPLESVTLDVQPGGALKATMLIPDGPRIDWEGRYVEVDRPNKIAFTLSDNPTEYEGVPLVATFTSTQAGTEASITQNRGAFDDAQVEATVAGYNSFFDAMERVIEELRLTP